MTGQRFLSRNLDYIIGTTLIGALATAKIAPNVWGYLHEGHQQALEAALVQGGLTIVGLATIYAVVHQYHQHNESYQRNNHSSSRDQ